MMIGKGVEIKAGNFSWSYGDFLIQAVLFLLVLMSYVVVRSN